ncbi:MAG: MFS transporter [Anaerolineae bacterium]
MAANESQPRWAARFFAVFGGQALSLLGSSVAQFALVWWITEHTGSATVLAMATLVAMLPGVLLGPFVGALVDRWNRRLVMIVADTATALVSAWLAYLFWVGALQIWHVYVIMLLRGLFGTFHFPAMQASTTLMVPKEHLARVSGLHQTLFGAMSIVAPPVGALLLSLLPLHAIMAIDVVTAASAVLSLLLVHIPQPERALPVRGADGRFERPSLLADVRAGMRYVLRLRGMVAVLLLAAVLNLLINPAFALLPLLVTNHFAGGALELGWLNSAWGIGLVLGGLILSAWGGFRKRIVTVLVGIVGLGLGVLVVGLTPAAILPLAIAGLLFGGLMNSLCNGASFALLQEVVVPEMQGRVFTVVLSITSAMAPLGLAVAGPVADAYGVRAWFLVAGVVQLVLGLGAFAVPAIMSVGSEPVAQHPSSPSAYEMGASAATVE